MPNSSGDSLGVQGLLDGYSGGKFSPTEVLAHRLQLIEDRDDAVGSVQACVAQAYQHAAHSDAMWKHGTPRRLEGIPFGVKDIIQVVGEPTTFGSSEFSEFRSSITAAAVSRLEDAGGVLVAKLSTYEFASGPNDRTHNPWGLARRAGGSSSGSAASVAARFLPLTVGTDTGGSIRVPAAWCGVVGLKPTYGRVSCHGIAPLSWTLDHVGPMTLSVDDAAIALEVLSERGDTDWSSSSGGDATTEGLTIGRPDNWFFDHCDPAIAELVEAALDKIESLGAKLVKVEIPLLEQLDPDAIKHVLVGAEVASFHEPMRDRWSRYSAGFAANLEFGSALSATDYVKALRLRSVLATALFDVLERVDALVMPTSGIEAPEIETEYIVTGGNRLRLNDIAARNTSPFNLGGLPALTVPCGFTPAGLPAGLQIVSSHWQEKICFQIGRAYQRATDFHSVCPDLT